MCLTSGLRSRHKLKDDAITQLSDRLMAISTRHNTRLISYPDSTPGPAKSTSQLRAVYNWLDIVGSVTRGFSRHYVLTSIKEVPMSGKEIIDKAISESGGIWKPLPGLIYPLLGRLIQQARLRGILLHL